MDEKKCLKSTLQVSVGNQAPGTGGSLAVLDIALGYKLLIILEEVYKHALRTKETFPCSKSTSKKKEMCGL